MAENEVAPDVSDPSVVRLLRDLRESDEVAASRLWKLLQQRLICLAQREVSRTSPTGYDEEDVALSAFDAFCRAIRQGRYGGIVDQSELWQLLTVITLNKARRRARDENRRRRGGGVSRLEMTDDVLSELASDAADPALTLMMQDECLRLLAMLQKPEVQLVAMLKVEGHTNDEVAELLGCTRRSVHRRLALIREIWTREVM